MANPRLLVILLLAAGCSYTASAEEPLESNATNTTVVPSVPEVTDDVSLVKSDTSVVLLGGMAFVMGIFYMVNAHVPLVVDKTWSMVSAAVSIFCAVMTYGLVNSIVNVAFHMKEAPDGTPPSIDNIRSKAVQLIVWWLLANRVLICCAGSLLHLKGYGTICGHILGFAAIGLYADIALSNTFRGSHWSTMLVFGIYMCTIAGLFTFTRGAHLCLKRFITSSLSPEEDDALHDQSKDTGTDFFCMGAGFLISFWLRFFILGSPPSVDGENGHSGDGVWTLTGAAVVLLALSVLCTQLNSTIQTRYGAESPTATATGALTTICSLSAAFCFLDAGNWHMNTLLGDNLMSHVAVALFFSVLAMIFIFLICIVMERGRGYARLLRGAFTGVSLTVGLSWEKVFDAALAGLGAFGGTVEADGTFKHNTKLVGGVTILLLLIVFPAWMVYMLPKDDDDLKKVLKHTLEEGSLPIAAFCDDQDLYDEESDEYDSENEEK
mmetsp:Transcript_89644/g.192089  ORF Transcript_89644/g.192089 Transcript_89644/m.192089 type:complete len:493 (+) Transcript_89644:53-1531(+)